MSADAREPKGEAAAGDRPPLTRTGILALVGWSLLLGALLLIGIRQNRQNALAKAQVEAQTYFELNLAYRALISNLGGVYANSDKVAPNPHLLVPDRDIPGPANSRLTLINPAYMTRLAFETLQARYKQPIRNRLTSLKPLNPDNAPTPWEQEALRSFEQGGTEAVRTESVGGRPFLLLMKPFVTEAGCLKCHAVQGYQVGDVRGGVSIAIPLSPYLDIAAASNRTQGLSYTLVWGLGCAGFLLFSRRRRIQAQQVQASETRYQSLAENALDAVISIDSSGRVTDWNAHCGTIFGWTATEVLGRELAVLIIPEPQRAAHRAGLARFLESGQGPLLNRRVETEALHRDGHVFPVELSIMPIGSGTGTSFTAFIRDISERKRAEEALRLSQRRLGAIFQESPVALAVSDLESQCFVQVNPAFQRQFRATSEQLIGRGAVELGMIRTEERDQVLKLHSGNDHSVRTQLEMRRLDGEPFTAELTLNAYDFEGKRYLLTSLFDVSEHIRAAEEHERLQAHLNQTQRMESIGQLAGGVAHDFNNMLAAILANTELALAKVDHDSPLRGSLEVIRTVTQRSASLTRQLLAFARKQAIAPRVMDLNEAIEGMLKMLRRIIGEDIDIAWRPGRQLWSVRVDPAQVDQVLVNLLVNARDAISGDGRVSIDTQNVTVDEGYCAMQIEASPGEFVVLSVSDNGCGMDPETLARIFEPFFTTKPLGQGTGMGLATVYGVVKQNGGFLTVYSEPGRGTTFKIYLPRHTGPEVASAAVETSTAPPKGTETVLLVEDNDLLLEGARNLLESLGYQVLAADGPEEAMHLADQHRGQIHLLFTDIVMPGMNGRELAKALLEDQPGLKCLFMSGYAANVVAHQGILEAGLPLLQKPFTIDELACMVRQVLDGR